MDKDKQFYSPKDAAELLSCNNETILRLIRRQKISAINIGSEKRRTYRIPTEELKKFIIKQKTNEQRNQPAGDQEAS